MPTSDSAARPFGAILTNAQLQRVYFQLLRKLQPDIFCDIGCHDGQASLLAQAAAPKSAVHAFEANPEIYRLHHERLAASGIAHHHLAISNRGGETSVFAPRTLSKIWSEGALIAGAHVEPNETGKASLLRRNEDATYAEFKVPAQSLDGFFRATGCHLQQLDFALWIDVEGAAAAVLKGAKTILESTEVIFVEVENFPFWQNQQTAVDVTAFLKSRAFLPVAQDREYGDDQFNILFVRQPLLPTVADLIPPAVYPESDLAVLIPCFNNPTHLRNMLAQLSNVGLRNLTVVDNGSTFPPHLALLASLRERFTILHRSVANGPRDLVLDPEFYQTLPQHFAVTDPDLEFNPNLPSDFLAHLLALTARHRVGKAGFSLDISEPERMIDDAFLIGENHFRIWEWEAQFWQAPLPGDESNIAYRALLDTTFAVYNKAFFDPANHLQAIRVAGRYTARHLPWYRDHQLPTDEAACYRATSKHSFYAGPSPDAKTPTAPEP
ncbi:MAG: FkbM family methyltransferase [Chthoniobacterales bacterium]